MSKQDANGLYSHALAQEMPAGFYFRRRSPDFILTQGGRGSQSSMAAYEWLTYMEITRGWNIILEYSSGAEYRVGARKLPVDGYVAERNLILEFKVQC